MYRKQLRMKFLHANPAPKTLKSSRRNLNFINLTLSQYPQNALNAAIIPVCKNATRANSLSAPATFAIYLFKPPTRLVVQIKFIVKSAILRQCIKSVELNFCLNENKNSTAEKPRTYLQSQS